MSFRTTAPALAVLILLASTASAADKSGARVERIGDVPSKDIFVSPALATADTCLVSENEQITTRINGWVTGFELYKSYMNPANDCPNPYPYLVTEVNMPMMFDGSTSITVSVDVEAVDSTTIPGCTVPGVLLSVSSTWEAFIPEPGWWNIWIPLDSPVTVNGPFFAGFYIGNEFAAGVNPSVLTDEFPAPCATFNIWSEEIGWVDLTNNEFFDFPGRLAMEVAGVPGGGGSGVPVAELLTPAEGDVLYGTQELWAWDRGLSERVDHVLFEYSNGGPFIEIGRDFDGSSPLRDGVHAAVTGNAYSLVWDFSYLPEGYYDIRATLADSTGGTYSATAHVYLEPTPPTARIVAPVSGGLFCAPLDIEMSISDENMSYVQVLYQQAQMSYSAGITPMAQATVGDDDGDPADGNPASEGEFGDYYSAPVALTMAAHKWYDRGIRNLFQEGTATLAATQVAEGLAEEIGTRQTLGSYDEAVYTGAKRYVESHGGGFAVEMKRYPSYTAMRIWVEEEQRAVLLGLSGSLGFWVTVDGFGGWLRNDTTYQVSVASPLTGSLLSASWRDRAGYSEIYLEGTWYRVDLMLSLLAEGWTVSRSIAGTDFIPTDGWSVHWTPSGIFDGAHYFLRAVGHDIDDRLGPFTVFAENNCAAIYIPGDLSGDRETTIEDLYVLIEFISQGGEEPFGGAVRADCNCDNAVNIADIIYYMNYLYGGASSPCR